MCLFIDKLIRTTENCLVCQIFKMRYGPNYDLDNSLDRSVLQFIVELDKYYIENKILKPTSLFGIFET